MDWDKKEQIKASLRPHIKRLLVKYRYPPDKQESAIVLVMEQAERLATRCRPDEAGGTTPSWRPSGWSSARASR